MKQNFEDFYNSIDRNELERSWNIINEQKRKKKPIAIIIGVVNISLARLFFFIYPPI